MLLGAQQHGVYSLGMMEALASASFIMHVTALVHTQGVCVCCKRDVKGV